MIQNKVKTVFQYISFSSLNVVLATLVCFIAFYKLPNNQPFTDFLSLAQLGLTCWAIYILDRLRDNISSVEIITDRHKFHYEHQFILQILLISSVAITTVIALFQPFILNIYGIILLVVVVFYVYFLSPKYPFLKELFMPIIYIAAVVGVPFVLNSSISFSSWILALMFFGVVIQNALSFSLFESEEGHDTENICSKIGQRNTRKVINYVTSLNIFLVIFFFANQLHYPNLLSFILVTISISTSLIVVNSFRFRDNYRWIIDSLLFLPLVVF
ncbi:MAG: hypothetical protein K9I84_08695 [Leadbetterella sp.]|nr:hypothetical protein [Leadbetterella sp.]